MDIVSWTLRRGRYDQNKPLYIDAIDPARYLSANGTRTLVRKVVSGLTHHGLEKGNCVCVLSFNDIHYTSLYLGIIGAGGCFTGANPGYTDRELAHHLRMTGAKFLLTEIKTLDIAVAASEEVGIPLSNVFILNYRGEEVPSQHQSWETLLGHGEKEWVEVEDPDNTTAAYVSTSGTSGLPKAAIIPHSYLVSQAEFQERKMTPKQKITHLIAVPPFHVFTMPVQHGLPLRRGTPCYLMARFEETKFLDALENYKITQTVTVPPIMMALSKASDSKLQSLRRILVGGSCATDGMQQQLYAKLAPSARIVQVYGMTEVGWATCWGKREKDTTGSVGQALPGTKIRAVDIDGEIIDRDERTGNIQIYLRHAMKGYLNNPTATAETITPDGWVVTGDVGFVKNGNWYIIDRTKDLIKVRGWQVSPAEIEAVLLEHAEIVDAGVIGVPAKDGCGEIPMAFVVKSEKSELDENGVKGFLGMRLARYKNVDEVRFVDRIPRNPTGKILRRVLRDARGTDPTTADQAAASAYSNALKDLVTYQKSRASESVSGRASRSGSLTSAASTVESVGPPTPLSPPSRNPSFVVPEARKKRKHSPEPEVPRRRLRGSVAST